MYRNKTEDNETIYHTEPENNATDQDRDVVLPEEQVHQRIGHDVSEDDENNDVRYFDVDEIGDLLKSRKNLIYVFRLSDFVRRILPSFRQNVHIDIFEGRVGR